jgi:hypothetical protein
MIITYYEFVPEALVIQHAKHVRRIIFSSVTCPAVPYYIVICDMSGCTLLCCHL